MTSRTPIIENISDTARWVAMYRALETDREDAHFRDPYARLLAGERGEEILRRMPRGMATAWPMIVRTCIFDELILRCIERGGADTVLNLAAGLDPRPYRLPLPATLRWIEVDLPEILKYKEEKLSGVTPRCALERITMNLANLPSRRSFLERIGAASRKVAVVSEGFLAYLTPEQVGFLASDLAGQPAFHWWIIDLGSPVLMKRLQKTFGTALASGQARFQFAPEEGTDFFRKYGWKETEFRSTWEEAHRLKREMAFAWVFRLLERVSSPQRREVFRKMGASVLLERI